MKLQKAKKMADTISRDNNFIIPNHWIEAAKIARKVLKAFKDEVTLDNFVQWNQYNKFEYLVHRKCPIFVVIRHTKNWHAESLTEPNISGYIKINIHDDPIMDKNFKFSEKLLHKIIFSTLVHETIHYFQDILGLEEQLAQRERRKLVLRGSGFKQAKQNFLYATNWIEMDAELGTYFAEHKFKVPTLKQIIDHYNDWYDNTLLTKAIGTYVYNYFLGGKKDLAIREGIFNNEIKFNGELFS